MTRAKAHREGYAPAPFAFRQSYNEGTRIVAWTGDVVQLERLLLEVLARMPDELEILYKTSAEADTDDWQRYLGSVHKSALLELCDSHRDLILSDGHNVLCVRRPDTHEYLALDEHGILFLYFAEPSWLALCVALGFEDRFEEPLFGAPHWHVRPAGMAEKESHFIETLGLRRVT